MRFARLLALVAILGLGWEMFGPKREAPAEREPATVEVSASNHAPKTLTAAKEYGPVPSASLVKPAATPVVVEDHFRAERTKYRDLHAKVVLTKAEQDELEALLKNRELIEALPKTLVTYADSPAALAEQDGALDLLTEALRSGDRAAAERALGEVISDGQIEDSTRPESEREQLAGVKGEVLFQWLAFAPKEASLLESRLPGPVSRKVWDNVTKVQSDNHETSVAMASAHGG